MPAPNIVLIMTDQQRADSLGCYGADWIRTPNLDRLAAQGTRFTNCIVNNPICTPSRASVMTGKELPGHGVYRLNDILADRHVMFPARLGDAGYTTALFGKLHVSALPDEAQRRHPHDGFDIYDWCPEAAVALDSPFNGYARWLSDRDPAFLARLKAEGRDLLHHPAHLHLTHWAAAGAADFIRARAGKDQPFFCKMSVFDPHNPYEDYPPEALDGVDPDRLPAPVPADPAPRAVERERAGSYLGQDFTPEDIARMRLGYAASIAFLDREVGRVLKALDDTGTADDTLVIFTSDHGDSLGDNGLYAKGAALYEHVIRVPMILRWPGHVPAGQVSDALVQGHDIAHTCRAAAGLTPEGGPFETGLDIAAAARGEGTVREAAVCAFRNSGINAGRSYWDPPIHATAVRGKTTKLTAYDTEGATEFAFFDLAADPQERQNRMDDPACRPEIDRLMRHLAGWLTRAGASPPETSRG